MPNIPQKPKFVTDITWIQKISAGISGTCLLVALVTLVPAVGKYLFDNDKVLVSELRKYLSLVSFITAASVGIPQIKYLMSYLFDILEFYQKFTDFKKNKD